MRLRTSAGINATVPTSSMADIAFLLIIFFMVCTTFSVDRTVVDLPESEIRDQIVPNSAIIVIDKDGQVYVSDGSDSPSPALITDVLVFASELIAKSGNPNKFFLIKAAQNIPYRLIDSVIEQLRNAKVLNINLVTEQKERGTS